jgi:uncharacterized protein (DUF4213/DUF364 family)
MNIRARLQTFAASLAAGQRVQDARIGVGYCAVLLDDGQLGLAYTFLDGLSGGCDVYDGPRPLAGMPAVEFLQLFDSNNALESALALACANALINTPEKAYYQGASITHLDFSTDDRVGMIGHFAPIVDKIAPQVDSIEIFERTARPGDGIRGFDEAGDVLMQCDVALITSTSILNNSIEQILPWVTQCREVVMLGTSTPMSAEVFADSPVTLLSGIVVGDTAGVLQAVSEGGGTPVIRPFTRKVNLRCQ